MASPLPRVKINVTKSDERACCGCADLRLAVDCDSALFISTDRT